MLPMQENDIVKGLEDLSVKAFDREPFGVFLARRGAKAMEISF